MTCMRGRKSSNCGLIGPTTAELAAFEHLKKNRHRLIMGKSDVSYFSLLILIGSFSCLQVMITYMRAWMSSKFSQIRSGTTELAALEHLKNRCCPFFLFHSCGFTWEIVR